MANGLSILDLTELPAPWRSVMTVILRENCISFADLSQAVGALPEDQRLDEPALREVIAALSARGYLTEDTTAKGDMYRARVRRRAGRTMSDKLWCALDSAADESAKEGSDTARPQEPTERPRRKSLWDNLG